MKHVLVVDDEPSIAELVEAALTMHGFTVEVAHDGRDALRRVGDRKPDLVLTDFMMPFTSGLELAAALKSEAETRDVPIVLMTAVETPPAIARELFSMVLRKPFDVVTLIGAIQKVADGMKLK